MKAPLARRRVLVCVLAASLAAFAAPPLQAQSHWLLEGGVGNGRVSGGQYGARDGDGVWHWELGLTVGHAGSGETYIAATRFGPILFGNKVSTAAPCVYLPPKGGGPSPCPPGQPDAPTLQFTGGLFGVRHVYLSRLQLGAGIGAGSAATQGLGRTLGLTAKIDAALRCIGPLWLTGGIQGVSWTAGGSTLSTVPWFIGLRLH